MELSEGTCMEANIQTVGWCLSTVNERESTGVSVTVKVFLHCSCGSLTTRPQTDVIWMWPSDKPSIERGLLWLCGSVIHWSPHLVSQNHLWVSHTDSCVCFVAQKVTLKLRDWWFHMFKPIYLEYPTSPSSIFQNRSVVWVFECVFPSFKSATGFHSGPYGIKIS